MIDPADVPLDGPFEGIPEDRERLTVAEGTQLIGRFLWVLTGRSLGRLVMIFVLVFVGSFLPAVLLVLALTAAGQVYTRGVLLILAVLCVVPLSAVAGFNFVAYRGLRDIVEKLAFGRKIGAGVIASIEPFDRQRIPLDDFTDRMRSYFGQTRRQVPKPDGRLKRAAFFVLNAALFFAARFTLNRISRDCVVDGEVDLDRFAVGVGERADGVLIAYFKRLLWDLTRVVLVVAALVLWFFIVVVTQLVKLIP
ncbi:MAG: hypothetical protein AAFX76_03790 [Planctomycetota bacterium]